MCGRELDRTAEDAVTARLYAEHSGGCGVKVYPVTDDDGARAARPLETEASAETAFVAFALGKDVTGATDGLNDETASRESVHGGV